MKLLGYEIKKLSNFMQPQQIGNKVKVQITPPPRSFVDIGRYVNAIRAAESEYAPTRIDLYDIYQESIDYDAHLRTVIEKRVSNILNRSFTYVDAAGNEIEQVKEWMEAPKFRDFLKDILETVFWGYSVFEFNKAEFRGKDWFDYFLIPRKNVDPITGVVLLRQHDRFGVNFNDPPYNKTIMAIGEPRDLGLLKTATRYAIMKRNMLSDWASYSEIAGNNFQVFTYEGEDTAVKNQIDKLMTEQGANVRMRLPAGVDMDIKNATSTSANDLFEGFHDALNKEISKLILHQTMTTEGGQSRSQAEVHEREQGTVENNDLNFLLNVLNYEFVEYLSLWGLPEGRFAMKTDVATNPMIVTMPTGAVTDMVKMLADPSLSPEQKQKLLQVVFGVQEADAKEMI